MVKHIEAKPRSSRQIGFKSQGFTLFVPALEQPSNRNGTRKKANGKPGFIKPSRGLVELSVQKRIPAPSGFDDPAFCGTRQLDRSQNRCCLPPVVAGKPEIPGCEDCHSTDHVEKEKAPHNKASDAHGTSADVRRARGQARIFCAGVRVAELWPTSRVRERPLPYNGVVEFRLRDYRPEDSRTLWAIDQACFPPGIAYSQQEIQYFIGQKSAFTIVAEADTGEGSGAGEGVQSGLARLGASKAGPSSLLLGFLIAQVKRERYGHIITIDVLGTARRLGVGSELLNAAERRILRAGESSLRLETAIDNSAALAFYKRHGYVISEILPHYYSNGVDALVLVKELPRTSREGGVVRI